MRYLSIRREIEGSLPTVAELLRQKDEDDALRVMSQADIEIAEIGYDNWNGGTELWTIFLRVPVSVFVSIENRRDELAGIISKNFELVTGKDNGYWVSAEISPMRAPPPGLHLPDGKIGERTRAAILDEMRARGTAWHGALDEIAFLSRIFDLTAMPSHDSRFQNAEQDIWQHCINNFDWSQEWVYSDPRFRLYAADQNIFLKFICEVLHPIVRKDDAEQDALARAFNGHLRTDGWELVEDAIIDGRPAYVPQRKVHALGGSVQRIKAVAAILNSNTLYEDLRRLERIGDSEPGEAIALAKEIVESCCKLILDDRKVAYPEKAEIPELLKLLRKEIKIMPDGIEENAKGANEIRGILTSLGNIAHLLAPLRNAYGKGHGRGRDFKGLQPRHARLAIGAASTFVDFVLDRHLSQASAKSAADD
ncbi:abortive infection family protein [Paracoccus sp. R12_1]|uniref:abortive infection family protein n=1 Tax=unclassified Paracoccus (in: a-proteobacteria) TaxID=2688777 RepID=UPI001ADCDE74|nr:MULTISPECIES: abortive infection family protein [unclassified Paracoccus (in: a-proteobacteria)]MBO9457388.1 abortive infection family protein [Paracoccus sp. R12_2]MBO9488655.1 abortive infection family protein [Paracoccus sp. R12_1]